MIDFNHNKLSVTRQCELISLGRSSLYYQEHKDDFFNERLMRMIDEQFLQTPHYGVVQMYYYLNRILINEGISINVKRVRRLMRLMCIEPIYSKPKTSASNPNHKIYPYLVKGLTIDCPNQVWSTDITYIPMQRGWVYMVAIMDWYSRYVLSWDVSTTLDTEFCITAFESALRKTDKNPYILNSDQGSQFTSKKFTDVSKKEGIQISMDGRGHAYDNIFTERLWRSIKY